MPCRPGYLSAGRTDELSPLEPTSALADLVEVAIHLREKELAPSSPLISPHSAHWPPRPPFECEIPQCRLSGLLPAQPHVSVQVSGPQERLWALQMSEPVQTSGSVRMPGAVSISASVQAPGSVQAPDSAKVPGYVQELTSADAPGSVQASDSNKVPSGVQNPASAKGPGSVQAPDSDQAPDYVQGLAFAKAPGPVQLSGCADWPGLVQPPGCARATDIIQALGHYVQNKSFLNDRLPPADHPPRSLAPDMVDWRAFVGSFEPLQAHLPGMVQRKAPKQAVCHRLDEGPRDARCPDMTTLTARNIPRSYTQEMLLELWPNDGTYDILYLPYDSHAHQSTSQAFINFTSAEAAADFAGRWAKQRLPGSVSAKPLDIKYANIQGREDNLRQFRRKRLVRNKLVHTQPAIYDKDGQRITLIEALSHLS